MKKLLLLISFYPLTNTFTMGLTVITSLARSACTASRSLSTTALLHDHKHTPTFPIPNSEFLKKQETIKIGLRKKAYQQAEQARLSLKESFNILTITLEQQKNKMSLKQYCDISGKIQESLTKGMMDITIRLSDRLEEIDNKPSFPIHKK